MFENVVFNGQFRTYQQKVLDSSDRYLDDGHIHIVAAPGSGKTILGLELIRRLHEPCIILSPTTTIRNQWGERFTESFLGGHDPERYISYDLNDLAPITSVTYQALHAAIKQIKDKEDGQDYSTLDLIANVRHYGIKTVCLDEAHHLQSEWQKALETFISALDGEIKIIALTATPPYDAKPSEWKRYVDLCGEIDEEIFVPELIKQGTLCPHQDYIYFNYPTKAETDSFNSYRDSVAAAIEELLSTDIIARAYERLSDIREDYDYLFSNVKGIISFLSLCSSSGIKINKKLIKDLASSSRLPRLTASRLNDAVNFLLKSTLISEQEREICCEILKRYGVFERGEAALELNESLKKKLVSSLGKLKSIEQIVKSEAESKKDGLRLLILTDYIKKENISVIGSDKEPSAVSVVSIFETVRETGINVGALSGSLVILPDFCADILRDENAEFSVAALGDTGYSSYDFKANNREKVRLVGRLFEKGALNVLVGTKSLLGEGWDAPCVNSLILASFVGSFMLSNQMRGRAIRTNRNDPNKTANIWHLVTIERPHLYADGFREKRSLLAEESKNDFESYDFNTVARRFDCFVAPNYTTGEIESGILRITAIHPPYDEKGIARINDEMIERAKNGEGLIDAWNSQVNNSASAKLNEAIDIPKTSKLQPPFVFLNIAQVVLLSSLLGAVLAVLISTLMRAIDVETMLRYPIIIFSIIISILIVYYICQIIFKKILKHCSPARSVRTFAQCILKAMQELNIVSNGARVNVMNNAQGTLIVSELLNASVHDQNIFQTAIKELLSPIENPRYILIPRVKSGHYNYRNALACPEILGSKSMYAECFADYLKQSMGNIETVYTRTENGRQLILKCRKKSYITYNDKLITNRRKHISRWE